MRSLRAIVLMASVPICAIGALATWHRASAHHRHHHPGWRHGFSRACPCAFRLRNVAAERGLHFRWPSLPRPLSILDSMGGGCAFLDYDNDGWMDVLLVSHQRVALFKNLGGGHFRDVTALTGLDTVRGCWMGCAIGDVDGDGYLDILLTGYHRLALLRNVQGSRFADVTARSGLDPTNRGKWALSAAFMDLDGTGKLALILTNYLRFGPGDPRFCRYAVGIDAACPPVRYRPEYPELWRNDGRGHFRDVTKECGLEQLHGRSMAVALADIDGSGRMSYFIGNDGTPAELALNLGNMRFRNIGRASGVATNAMGHAIGAMGADWADYDGDGRPDLAITAFSDEAYSLYHNEGGGQLTYVSDRAAIMGATYLSLGFGAKWIDIDNDGWPDLAFANGHILDQTSIIFPGTALREPIMLFHNEPGPCGRRFLDLAPSVGAAAGGPILGRGLASGDFENNGRLGLLVVDFEGGPVLLANDSAPENHWITFDVRSAGPNRFSYGAEVTIRTPDRSWSAAVSPAAGFLSSSDPRVHFGLGHCSSVDSATVRWPDGRSVVIKHPSIDRIVTVHEPMAR